MISPIADRPYSVCAFSDALTDITFHCDAEELLQLGFTWSRSVRLEEWQKPLLKQRISKDRDDTSLNAGGSPANTICGLSRMGIPCVFIGITGDDDLGKEYLAALGRAGVTPKVVSKAGATGVCYTLISPDGERSFGIDLGVASSLKYDEFDFSPIAKAGVFHTSAYQLRGGPDAGRILSECFRISRENSVKISLDLGDPGVVEECRDELDALLLGGVEILQANIHEARMLLRLPDAAPLELARGMSKYCSTAVVTKSEQGCSVVSGKEEFEMPALPVTEVVDFNGAGDAFGAGFLFGYIQKLSLEHSVQIGQYHASLVIRQLGAQIDMPIHDIANAAQQSFTTAHP